MNRFAFFHSSGGRAWRTGGAHGFGGAGGGRWLRFRFWYALYEYVMFLPNLAIGFYLFTLLCTFSLFTTFFTLWGGSSLAIPAEEAPFARSTVTVATPTPPIAPR